MIEEPEIQLEKPDIELSEAPSIRYRKRHNKADQENLDRLTAIDFTGDPGRTLQEPAEDADINVLMKRMGVKDGSALPHFPNPRALYGDFTEAPTDPVELADMLHQGQLAFMRLPGAVRQRYGTPEQLFAWMQDDANYEEAVKLGLLEKKPEPTKSDLDKLVEKMDTFVSSSTSRDKEPLVPTQPSKKEK